MRKYKNHLLTILVALFVMANSSCSEKSKDPAVTPDPPVQPASKLKELETQLETVKNSIIINEQRCYTLIGDATRAIYIAQNLDLSPEDKKVAEEKAQFASDAVKDCEAEKDAKMKELMEKQAAIEAEINSLKDQ